MEERSLVETALNLIRDYPSVTAAIGSIVSLLAGSGVFAFLRRPKKVGQGEAKYLVDGKLLSPPIARPAYSDRMAYVLAEMSALAYVDFEGSGSIVRDAAKNLAKVASGSEKEVETLLEAFADELLVKGVDSEDYLRKVLEKSGFKLLGTVNVAETQAFVCRREAAKAEPPYVVVAYRGTEKKVSDWLTDLRAVPTVFGEARVHTGFLQALKVATDFEGKTALERVKAILEGAEAKDANNRPLPLFITGHSLGGALALMTARELDADASCACYTYGAPRVANYEYFKTMKTPVYRVVNSVDIVPRVPPGAIITVILKLVQGLSWITGFTPISKLFDRLEVWLDKLNGYRHFGDERYLTDVASGRFETVRLLSNPPAIDRLVWLGQQLGVMLFAPVTSHGMEIYRKKLHYLANDRNKTG